MELASSSCQAVQSESRQERLGLVFTAFLQLIVFRVLSFGAFGFQKRFGLTEGVPAILDNKSAEALTAFVIHNSTFYRKL